MVQVVDGGGSESAQLQPVTSARGDADDSGEENSRSASSEMVLSPPLYYA